MEFGVCSVSLGWKWINWSTCRWGKVAWNDCIPAKQNKDGFPAWNCKTGGKFMSSMISFGLFFFERKGLARPARISQPYCEFCGGQYICLSHVLLGLLELQALNGITYATSSCCVGGETVQEGASLQSETELKTRTQKKTAQKDALMFKKSRQEQSEWFLCIWESACVLEKMKELT